MSNTTLHNENVSVTLKSLGAELTSIKDASGTEYLWQGNPEFWSGQAPVLFPIVGCLRNGTATIGDNKTCSFGRHGLCLLYTSHTACYNNNFDVFSAKCKICL